MMKVFSMIVLSVVLVTGLTGCGKTLTELRTDGDAVVDNGAKAVNEGVGLVASIVKKALAAGFAIYDIGKKLVEDSKDNVGTVVTTVTGADETPK